MLGSATLFVAEIHNMNWKCKQYKSVLPLKKNREKK